MYYLTPLLILFFTPAHALLLGSINYHFDTRANQMYSGEIVPNFHLSPMIGLESKDSVTFFGVNSIHEPMLGHYRRLDYNFILGLYIQDTYKFKLRNINYFLDSWIIPIVGLEYNFKHVGLVISPAVLSLYWRY